MQVLEVQFEFMTTEITGRTFSQQKHPKPANRQKTSYEASSEVQTLDKQKASISALHRAWCQTMRTKLLSQCLQRTTIATALISE